MIDPDIEQLARAMTIAVGLNPDDSFGHEGGWSPWPRAPGERHDYFDMLWYSPNWHRYIWKAQQFIFNETAGTRGVARYINPAPKTDRPNAETARPSFPEGTSGSD